MVGQEVDSHYVLQLLLNDVLEELDTLMMGDNLFVVEVKWNKRLVEAYRLFQFQLEVCNHYEEAGNL